MRPSFKILVAVIAFAGAAFGATTRATTTGNTSTVDIANPASFNHKYTFLNGQRYHYVDQGPQNGPVVLALHGFPDLWYSWRYQIHYLLKKGYRVVAPDLLGFGETDGPRAPDVVPLDRYSYKNSAKDLTALLDQLGIDKVTLLGHDAGGMMVWRYALYYPERVQAVVSLTTPYFPPTPQWVDTKDVVAQMPFWKYQLYFAEPAAETQFDADPELFVRALFRTAETFPVLFGQYGVDFQNLAGTLENGRKCPRDPFMTQAEQDYYVKSLARRSFHSGLNWYKIRRINYEDELALVGKVITHPCLMVSADKDFALPPALTAHMPQVLPNLKMVVVQNASHWVNTEDPDAVNKALKTFLGFN